MMAAFFDPYFLYRKLNGVLTGITGLATDDSISTGLPEYQKSEEMNTKSFITRKTAKLPFRFLGTLIEYDEDQTGLFVSQDIQIKKLKLLSPTSIDHDAFRSVRGQLLYIAQTTRPDISYRVSQLCQVKHKHATRKHIKLLNDTIQHLKETTNVKLRYRKMDKDSLKLYCFVDIEYNTNEDHTSQLGMIIGLFDKHDTFHFIHWSSSKCQRATRSMLASETYAFSNGFDYAVSIKMLFHDMGIKIPLYVFTDSKSIFDTITASKRLRELRLMNDISEIRREYKVNEIDNVAWIRSAQNIADDLTRLVGNDILLNTLRSGTIHFYIEQWICKDDDNITEKK